VALDVDASDLDARAIYALMTGLIVPRPIAWVTTTNAEGVINLAPFSYFSGLGSDPPMVTLGIANKRDGVAKDTLRNIRETRCFCVNLVEEQHAVVMNATSAELPPNVSELEQVGLASLPCTSIPGVRVRDARAALECRLVDMHTYGRRVTTNLVVGEIVHFHVDDALLLPDGITPSPDAIAPVSRLGGPTYAKLGARFTLERPR
jgi:flavin reductase (DIM6/NTAB) family NADH-FMN oxidoreductase RutF